MNAIETQTAPYPPETENEAREDRGVTPRVVALCLLLVVNPLLRVLGRAFTRNETLTVYISCLFCASYPDTAPSIISCRTRSARFISRRRKTAG